MDVEDASAIGARARRIRKRRGLSLDVVAGLVGIKKQYLSMLELGQRGFNRRGLIEDLAEALGCSVADLTGQPYLAPDRATLQGRAALPGISLAGCGSWTACVTASVSADRVNGVRTTNSIFTAQCCR